MFKRLRVDYRDEEYKLTEFTLFNYGTEEEPEYRIELKVDSVEEIKRYYRTENLIGVRLHGQPEDREPQLSSISPQHIEGLGRPRGYCERLREAVRAHERAGGDPKKKWE